MKIVWRLHQASVRDVYQVMRHARLFFGRGLGRADIHLAINLPRVRRDDFAAQAPRQVNRQCRLTYRRRPDDDKQI